MAKKLISDINRFFQHIEITVGSCWIWTGRLDKDGYAITMKIGSHTDNSRRMVRPHRFIYEHFIDAIPSGYTIDHLCRRRCCVNPAHLEPVTSRVNTQRGWRKNKQLCKSGHPLSGDNLYIDPKGYRFCRICRRGWTKQHEIKTDGAAQKKYEANNREKRRLGQAARKAAWTPERLTQERQKYAEYDALHREERKMKARALRAKKRAGG